MWRWHQAPDADPFCDYCRPKPPEAGLEPTDRLSLPKKLATAAMAGAVLISLVAGGASGVVLSPDDPSPSPDWRTVIDAAIAHHLASDHPEVTPSPSTSPVPPSPSAWPTAIPPASPAASARRATGPTDTSQPTARPTARPTPMPTAVPAPTCFRPGNPHSGHDPCSWPPDG